MRGGSVAFQNTTTPTPLCWSNTWQGGQPKPAFPALLFVKTQQATNMRFGIGEKAVSERNALLLSVKRGAAHMRGNLKLGPRLCAWLEWAEELAQHISSLTRQADTHELFKSAAHSANELPNSSRIRETVPFSLPDTQRAVLTGSVSIARKWEAKARKAKVLNSVPLMTL